MLRKDVKLGFIIGGVMLAVVIVYVLVVPGGDKKNVGFVNDESQTPAKTDGNALPGTGDAATPEQADKSNAPPADPSKLDAGQSPATMPSGNSSASNGASNNGGGADWNKLLAEGSSSPTMMSETPTLDTKHAAEPDAASGVTPSAAVNAAANPAADLAAAPTALADNAAASSATAEKATPDLAIDTTNVPATNTPATQPAVSTERTHIVQPGETLSSIAMASYGTSKKWKFIADANPNINPNRLAPGTKLVIPAPANSAASSASSAVTAELTVNSQTQYEVQPNDSLYRISMKLYGKADHVDKLYQDNKDVIGADPRRLKLHMVLKLSDPPTSSLTTASR
jgi:nucleoid-associated protein YgaU